MPYADQARKRDAVRAWYARNPEARRKAIENAAAYRRKSPEARERWRQWKRNARAKKGATPRSVIRERRQDRLVEQNARQAWRWWLKNAPDAWIAAYYDSLGKPWINPRLSIADAYRIRYAMDTDFYHREYARLQAKKVRQRSILGRRAGGMSASELREVREGAEDCYYCGSPLMLRHRTIDHVIPLIAGGQHERGNVVVSCRSCNSKKGDRMTCGALGRNQKVLPHRTKYG
jgi:5-methylcytosine-specific restriction endonuclease McrA